MVEIKRINFAGLVVDDVSSNNIVSVLVDLAKKKETKAAFVTYLNAYHFNLAQKNKKYLQVIKKADLVYADGWGIVLAAWLFGYKLPGRLTTFDFFSDFCQRCEKEKVSLFLLGGEDWVVRKTAEKLKNKFPNLNIKGFYKGYFSKREEGRIIDKINKYKPDFLIVNMGAPKQEFWLDKNLAHLKVKVGWAIGGTFNYVSGKTPRVPYWLGRLGFEWLFRLSVEPKRLWKRYLIELPKFGFNVLRLRLKR